MELSFDIAVVGGGVLGTFHAYHALKRGLKVVLLEQHARPDGATVRNFGQIVPSGMAPKWQAYGRASLAIYQDLQSQADISVRQLGSIYLASDAEEMGLLEELRAINQQHGYPSELMSAAACLRAYPGLKASYCKGGLFFPEELSVNPRLMIHRLHRYLEAESGLAVMQRCRVHTIEESGDGCLLMSSQGQIKAKRAIVCSGSELQALYPELAAASGLQLVKLQMLRLKPQAPRLPGNILTGLSIRRYESFQACPSYAAVKAKEPSEAFWKQYGVHILFKQEADGSVILGDSHEYLPLADGQPFDFDLKAEISSYMLRQAAAIFELDYQAVDRQWAGVYTQCEQGDLYQAQVGSAVHIVTGIGGKGMTGSPGFAAHHIDEILA